MQCGRSARHCKPELVISGPDSLDEPNSWAVHTPREKINKKKGESTYLIDYWNPNGCPLRLLCSKRLEAPFRTDKIGLGRHSILVDYVPNAIQIDFPVSAWMLSDERHTNGIRNRHIDDG